MKPRDPVTNVAFPGNLIPAGADRCGREDDQDKYVPVSNLPETSIEVSAPDPLKTDEMTLKVDHNFSSTRSFAVSYFFLKGVDMQPLSGTGNIPWVDRDFAWKQQNLNVADTWILSATKINQLRFTYVRQYGARVNNPTTSLGDLNSNFRFRGIPRCRASPSPATSRDRRRSPAPMPAAISSR